MRVDSIGLLFMGLTLLLIVLAATVPAIQQRRQKKDSD